MYKILLSVMLLIFSSNVLAVELWQGLELGASSQQILKEFPNTKVDSNRNIGKGFDDRLVLNDYFILDKEFKVLFLMKDNRLKEVMLSTQLNKSSNHLDFTRFWEDMVGLLSYKYGDPYDNFSLKLNEQTTIKSAYWTKGDLNIKLTTTTSMKLFMISYDAKTLDNASKL